MKSFFISLTLIASISAIANEVPNLEGSGSNVVQKLDGKIIASGDKCDIVRQGTEFIFTHNAKIDGWDVGDIEVIFDVDNAVINGNTLEVSIGTVSSGYCGDFASAKSFKKYMRNDGEHIVYGESYRCTFDFKKTIHEHICKLD